MRKPFSQLVNTWSGLQLISGPTAFFTRLKQDPTGLQCAVTFLTLSAVFFAGAGLLAHQATAQPAVFGILLVNALGMCFLSLVVGYSAMVMCFGRRAPFTILFKVYAFSTGVTLIFSWIPSSLWFTEPWKWWLIYRGLTGAAGLTQKEAGLVVLLSIAIIFLFFQSLMAITA